MSLKNEGFFLLELLLSLSALLMLCMFFMPLLMDISNQSHRLVSEKKAKQFVFEELQADLLEDRTSYNYAKVHNGTEYEIYWNQSPVNGQKEVCVEVVEQTFHPRIKICAIPE